jgi:hypothetical protein
MIFPCVERTTYKRLDVLAELYGVIGALMHFIAPGIAPRLKNGEVVA